MTEDLKKILEESLKNAKKEMAGGCMAATSDFLDSVKLAMISQEIGNAIKEHVIVATKFFVEKNNLPKEEFFDYLIYGTIASTIRTIWDYEDDDDDDDCECENCHCQPPKKPSSDNGSARAEADSADAAIAAINALKDLLSKNN